MNLLRWLHRERAFSNRALGPGERAAGIIADIRMDLAMIEARPRPLTEWVDVAALALDGAWRTGAEPEEICEALQELLERNEQRQ
jgi:hypothetical protein